MSVWTDVDETRSRAARSGVDATLPTAPPTSELPRQVGRYQVHECIGEGGMGVVLRAVDPKLGREVAVKLLHARPEQNPGADAHRLLREAQALAQLSHPHVVDVYDVGMSEGRVFIAMEFVRGDTLATWLLERPSLPEIVDAFVQAGEGLMAAHAAGLVHRDFKPANVLRGPDGRVRVADFGLAAPARGDESATFQSQGGQLLDMRMTATGCAVGTPAYMSPEAHDGRPVDARSDQWSFCASLYEALYRQRPFLGADVRSLAEQVRKGVRPPPATADVPTHLRELVLRGLSVNPDDRWPSMATLVEQLRPRRRPRWRWLAAGVVVTTGVGGLVLALGPRADAACERSADAVTQVWNETARAAVEDAFSRTGLSYAAPTWRRVAETLDAHALALSEARRQACAASPGGGDSGLDRRVACLGRRLSELRGLVAEFEQAEASTVRNAVQAVGDLRPADECEGEALLATAAAPPPSLEPEVERAYADMARVRTMTHAGSYDRARMLAERVLADATRLAYAPLVAEARYLHGNVLQAAGEYTPAEHALVEARLEALALGDDPLVAATSTELVSLVGSHLRRPDDAEQWVRHARAAIDRLADPSSALTDLEGTLGNLEQSSGNHQAALEHFERALASTEAERGHLHPESLLLRNNIALTHHHLGNNLRARALLERILVDRTAVYGEGHPDVSSTYGNLGVVEQTLGELAAAALHTQLALDGLEASIGSHHPLYPQLLSNLANTQFLMGSFHEALATHRRAKELLVRSLGPHEFLVGRSLVNMGVIHHRLQQYDDARRVYQQGREILEEHLRPDHPELSVVVNNLAEVDRDTDHLDEAIAGFDHAIALIEKARGPEDPELAYSLAGRGQTHVLAHRPAQGLVDLQRAVELLEGAQLDPETLMRTRKLLATTLWETGARTQGLQLMEQVRGEAERLGEQGRASMVESEVWLAEHEQAQAAADP